MSHGGIINLLRDYLIARNYAIHDSLDKEKRFEVRNCSITEVVLGENGPGQFIRMGDWDHILEYLDSEYASQRLENSTG